jgi:RimJ/RimL family protein N-acetyltransferase
VSLEFPRDGLRQDGLVFRLPTRDDLPVLGRAFADPEIAEAANFPPLDAAGQSEFLDNLDSFVSSGRMVPTLIVEDGNGGIVGGASLHNVAWEHSIGEIGYWLFAEGRGRGAATLAARTMAEFGHSLGLERVQALVHVGNEASERVLERAGFTREGVLRSLPRRRGPRGDSTIFSLLRGE